MSTTPSSVTEARNPTIRAVLLCDLVASTRLIERVGDATAAELLAQHDRSARDLLAEFNGREIDKSDGFLLLFERPIEAVRFAMAYQAKLRDLGAAFDAALVARVGIHLGEVVLRGNSPEDVARGAKALEVEGLAKAMAARVMSLAGDGRVLLTRAALDVARRAAVGENDDARLRWIDHGHYRFAGIDDPVAVFEVIEAGAAEPTRPTSSEKAQRTDDRASDSVSASPDRSEPTLAVLAFDNLSSDPEMQFFSDGVSEEIIHRLSRGAKLRVIGRTSSFQFRGERKAEAALRLNCSHVLDGAIRRAAERVRITAHLVEASSQTTLWSDRYDRGLEDIFAVQDEISEHIAGALDRTFASFSTQSVNPAVYDLYLRANPKSYAPAELRTSVELLEIVTQRAPHFAEAWGRLAFLRAFLHFYQPFADRPTIAERVANEASRALAIDPQNIDAMAGQLFVVPPFGRFVEAHATLTRLRRAPGSGDGRRYVGWYLRTMGLVRESLAEAERAYRLDALDPMSANLVALGANGRGANAGSDRRLRRARRARSRDELSGVEPVASASIAAELAGGRRAAGARGERQLREFQDGLPFIHAKRDPTRRGSRHGAERCTRMSRKRAASTYRGSCIRRTWGWSTTRTRLRRLRASVRPAAATTSWGRTGIARRCCFSTECRNFATTRALRACVRVWGWSSSG